MRLLVIGGTRFVGRHVVEAALSRHHTVTLFNRGRTEPGLFPSVEHLRGDRDGGLGPLAGRRWDAVVDTCGYVPRVVRASAGLLADHVEHYTFISTISVYASPAKPGIDEGAPVGTLPDASVEDVTNTTYGPLKVLCEQAVADALPGRALIVRPGLIVGPHDPSDRFTYWPARVARGGEVLAPGHPDAPVQFIDGRDLAAWIVRMAEARRTGVYNATGPDSPLTIGAVLEACRDVTAADVRFTWASEQFLLQQGIEPEVDMPLWVPAADAPFNQVNCDRAIAAGLTFRPLADTVRDTLAWDAARPADADRRAGLTRARESALLQEWHTRARAEDQVARGEGAERGGAPE